MRVLAVGAHPDDIEMSYSSKQVTVGTCPLKAKRNGVNCVDENPVWFNMTVSTVFPLPIQMVLMVLAVNRLAFSQLVYHNLQLLQVIPTLPQFSHISQELRGLGDFFHRSQLSNIFSREQKDSTSSPW